MTQIKSENSTREQRILDAAAELIIHYGYDKTSVSDIADTAGISKGAIYLHFTSKDELFEALLYREFMRYAETWFARIEADPNGGTLGGMYKAVLYAVNHHPFMTAIVKQDTRIFGNYLRKPGNLFTSMDSPSLRSEFLQTMQAAGAIRTDVDPQVMAHIMDMLSYGLVGLVDFKNPAQIPPFDKLIETIAEMIDRMLTPLDGASNEIGKTIIRQMADKALAQLEQIHAAQQRRNK